MVVEIKEQEASSRGWTPAEIELYFESEPIVQRETQIWMNILDAYPGISDIPELAAKQVVRYLRPVIGPPGEVIIMVNYVEGRSESGKPVNRGRNSLFTPLGYLRTKMPLLYFGEPIRTRELYRPFEPTVAVPATDNVNKAWEFIQSGQRFLELIPTPPPRVPTSIHKIEPKQYLKSKLGKFTRVVLSVDTDSHLLWAVIARKIHMTWVRASNGVNVDKELDEIDAENRTARAAVANEQNLYIRMIEDMNLDKTAKNKFGKPFAELSAKDASAVRVDYDKWIEFQKTRIVYPARLFAALWSADEGDAKTAYSRILELDSKNNTKLADHICRHKIEELEAIMSGKQRIDFFDAIVDTYRAVETGFSSNERSGVFCRECGQQLLPPAMEVRDPGETAVVYVPDDLGRSIHKTVAMIIAQYIRYLRGEVVSHIGNMRDNVIDGARAHIERAQVGLDPLKAKAVETVWVTVYAMMYAAVLRTSGILEFRDSTKRGGAETKRVFGVASTITKQKESYAIGLRLALQKISHEINVVGLSQADVRRMGVAAFEFYSGNVEDLSNDIETDKLEILNSPIFQWYARTLGRTPNAPISILGSYTASCPFGKIETDVESLAKLVMYIKTDEADDIEGTRAYKERACRHRFMREPELIKYPASPKTGLERIITGFYWYYRYRCPKALVHEGSPCKYCGFKPTYTYSRDADYFKTYNRPPVLSSSFPKPLKPAEKCEVYKPSGKVNELSDVFGVPVSTLKSIGINYDRIQALSNHIRMTIIYYSNIESELIPRKLQELGVRDVAKVDWTSPSLRNETHCRSADDLLDYLCNLLLEIHTANSDAKHRPNRMVAKTIFGTLMAAERRFMPEDRGVIRDIMSQISEDEPMPVDVVEGDSIAEEAPEFDGDTDFEPNYEAIDMLY